MINTGQYDRRTGLLLEKSETTLRRRPEQEKESSHGKSREMAFLAEQLAQGL